jgi:hypothetical protein
MKGDQSVKICISWKATCFSMESQQAYSERKTRLDKWGFCSLWYCGQVTGVCGWCNVGGEPQWTTSPSAPFSRSIALCVQWKPTSFWRDTIDLHQSHARTSQQRGIMLFYNFHKQRSMSVQWWMAQMCWIFGHHLHSPCGHRTQCCLCKKDWRYKVVCCHNQREKYRTLWLSQTCHHSWLPNASASTKPNQAWTSAMIWWHRHHWKLQELATEQFCSTRLYLAQPPIANVY